MTLSKPFPAAVLPGLRAGAVSRPGLAVWTIPPLCAAILIWPALWNGYPIVFADTGTYLSQAMHRYLGWDRPAFYSLFIFPQHLRLTTWPVVGAQACLTVFVLDLTRRALGTPRPWFMATALFLALATWLPWMVSELMPDLLTPLLVLLLSLLVFAPERFETPERLAMTALTVFAIAAQTSSVLLSAVLLAVFLPARRFFRPARRGAKDRSGLAPVAALLLAIGALAAVNFAGHGRAAISPFGNVFLLARVIYDGPGMTVLRRDCPEAGWRLCPWLDRFPPTSDEFLWDSTSPIVLAGGHKAVSADADAILLAAVRVEPLRLLRALGNNAIEQLTRFDSGDGLEPWDRQVNRLIDTEFPARESAAFHAARQQRNELSVPEPLAILHRVAALAGIVAAALLLPVARRRRHRAAGFLAMALLTLPVSATITGGLSTPHDRYQSRIVWLPACVALLSLPALLRRRDDSPRGCAAGMVPPAAAPPGCFPCGCAAGMIPPLLGRRDESPAS